MTDLAQPGTSNFDEREQREPGVARLLSYDEVAKIFGMTPRSVFDLVKDGRLAAVRIGRNVRFDPADVRRFIAASKGGAG